MNELNRIANIGSLQEGKSYYLKLSRNNESIPVFTEVTFVGYTSCPVIVIVQDARKDAIRCSREDLFGFQNVDNLKSGFNSIKPFPKD